MEWKKNFTRKKLLIWPDFFFLPLVDPILKGFFFFQEEKIMFSVWKQVKFYFLGDELSREKKFKDRICLCFLCGTESNFFVKNNIFCMCWTVKNIFFHLGKEIQRMKLFCVRNKVKKIITRMFFPRVWKREEKIFLIAERELYFSRISFPERKRD